VTDARASVVIVSHGRPRELYRCLMGVGQLLHHPFEIIVVADQAGLAALPALPGHERIRTARFEPANIAAARNLGIDLAAGEVVAFIDDDAVPEPTWLALLMAAFRAPEVAAAGGLVLARNGFDVQRSPSLVDATGRRSPLPLDREEPRLLRGNTTQAIQIEGTNCAYRRNVLVALGGFDENYRFYLDETDLNFRLGMAGFATALVPLAQVHHRFGASIRRTARRVPLSLHELGASQRYFLARHHSGDPAGALAALRNDQRRRLLRLLQSGEIAPGDVARLLATLEAGIADGAERQVRVRRIAPPPTGFKSFHTTARTSHQVVFAARPWGWRRAHRQAAEAVRQGFRATVLLIDHSVRFHHIRFSDDGYWEHKGGLFGRSERSDPLFRLWSFNARVVREMQRLSQIRPD